MGVTLLARSLAKSLTTERPLKGHILWGRRGGKFDPNVGSSPPPMPAQRIFNTTWVPSKMPWRRHPTHSPPPIKAVARGLAGPTFRISHSMQPSSRSLPSHDRLGVLPIGCRCLPHTSDACFISHTLKRCPACPATDSVLRELGEAVEGSKMPYSSLCSVIGGESCWAATDNTKTTRGSWYK
jgi:hypothetical protein